ncbi:calcium-binding protein, partial [Okeania sp. SIO2G5]|uniref:calcium-binding protein n=1 Tax=Okeania sp. SIO2G5 TaxID=2607796 RepID=UPI0013BFD361
MFLEPIFDPYGLARKEVLIRYTQDEIEYFNYTNQQFKNDQKKEKLDILEISSLEEYVEQLIPFIGDLIDTIFADPLLSYQRQSDGKKVVYGTNNSDSLSIKNYRNGVLEVISRSYAILPALVSVFVEKLIVYLEKQVYDLGLPEEEIGELLEKVLAISASPISQITNLTSEFLTLISSYLIIGGKGDDSIYGGFQGDELRGGDGNDYADGKLGDDTFFGGQGNDTYDDDGINGLLSSGNDYFDGGSGNDTFYGADGDDIAFGGNGNDNLHGENGADRLVAEDGDDYIEGGSGDDKAWGGSGNDIYDDD